MPTCSLHADIHHGLLLHADITPPVCYRVLREQHKLVTTHCHSSWRTWSSTQRAGNQASITASQAVQASLTHKSWSSWALSLRRDQPESLSPSLACAHTHTPSRLGPALNWHTPAPPAPDRLQAAMLHSPCYMTHRTAFHTGRKQAVFRGLKRKEFVSFKDKHNASTHTKHYQQSQITLQAFTPGFWLM